MEDMIDRLKGASPRPRRAGARRLWLGSGVWAKKTWWQWVPQDIFWGFLHKHILERSHKKIQRDSLPSTTGTQRLTPSSGRKYTNYTVWAKNTHISGLEVAMFQIIQIFVFETNGDSIAVSLSYHSTKSTGKRKLITDRPKGAGRAPPAPGRRTFPTGCWQQNMMAVSPAGYILELYAQTCPRTFI